MVKNLTTNYQSFKKLDMKRVSFTDNGKLMAAVYKAEKLDN